MGLIIGVVQHTSLVTDCVLFWRGLRVDWGGGGGAEYNSYDTSYPFTQALCTFTDMIAVYKETGIASYEWLKPDKTQTQEPFHIHF